MAATQGRTGKAGAISIVGNVVPITTWKAKLNVSFADATDSGNYVPATGTLPKSQLSGDFQVEGSIEGFYDTATTSTNITSNIKNPVGGPYAVVLKIDASTTWFSGPCDFSDVEFTVEVPGATMVKYSLNFKSNGVFVLT